MFGTELLIFFIKISYLRERYSVLYFTGIFHIVHLEFVLLGGICLFC